MRIGVIKPIVICTLALATLNFLTGCSREARAERYAARADKNLAEQKFERAEIEYLSAIRLGSTSPELYANLGSLYYAQGKMPQAYAVLSRAVEMDPKNDAARLKLGFVCKSLGSTAVARKHAAEVLDRQPGSGEALILLAECANTESEIKDAFRRIEATPASNKGGVEELLARATLKFRQNDLTAAEADLKQAIAKDPKSERAYARLAAVYLSRKQADAAEAALKTGADLAPLRSPVRIGYAQFLSEQGRHDEAIKFAQEITKKAPDYVPAWGFLAQNSYQRQRAEECSEYVKEVLKRDPVNYEGLTLNGKLLLAKGDGPGALKLFEWIVNSYGTNSEHYYNLAFAQSQTRQENQAIATLSRAIASSSNHVDAILLQSSLLLKQGNYAQVGASLKSLIARGATLSPSGQARLPHAFALLARAQALLRNTTDAAATYAAMQKAFPDLLEVRLEAADGLANLGRAQEARRAYAEYIERSTNTLGLLVAGGGMLRMNETKAAREAFEKAQKLSPETIQPVEALISLEIRGEQYSAAIDRAKAEVAKPNSQAVAWVLLGNAYMEKAQAFIKKANPGEDSKNVDFSKVPGAREDVNNAEAAYIKAAEIDPNLLPAYNQLARIYVSSNRKEEALAKLKSVVARTNDLTSYIQIALIHSQAQDHKSAAEIYEKALIFNPKGVVALNNLASIYSDQVPRLDRAYELSQRARQLAPNSPAIADTLGWVLAKQGQYEKALGLLEEAVKGLPQEPEVAFHLGMAYYMLGQEELAKTTLLRAADSPQSFPAKSEAAKRLEVLEMDPNKPDTLILSKLEKILTEKPDDVVALARVGVVCEREKNFERAATAYETLLKHSPRNPHASFKLAQIYLQHFKETDKAFEMAKVARGSNPDDPAIAHLLGRLAWLKGNWSYAVTLLEEAARKLPGKPGVSHDLAWAYYSMGRVSEAQGTMQAALENSDEGMATACKRFLGFVSAAGNPNQAAQLEPEVQQSLQVDPDYVPALVLRAASLERKGSYAEAAPVYERILSRYPNFGPALRSLTLLTFLHLNQPEKAYGLAVKARSYYPTDMQLARTLGILAFKRGENFRAEQLLREASSVLQEDAELFYYLGMAQKVLNMKRESKISLEKAMVLKLEQPLYAEAVKALQQSK